MVLYPEDTKPDAVHYVCRTGFVSSGYKTGRKNVKKFLGIYISVKSQPPAPDFPKSYLS